MTELLESSSLVGLFTVIIRRILIGSEFITQVSVEIKQENNLLISDFCVSFFVSHEGKTAKNVITADESCFINVVFRVALRF